MWRVSALAARKAGESRLTEVVGFLGAILALQGAADAPLGLGRAHPRRLGLLLPLLPRLLLQSGRRLGAGAKKGSGRQWAPCEAWASHTGGAGDATRTTVRMLAWRRPCECRTRRPCAWERGREQARVRTRAARAGQGLTGCPYRQVGVSPLPDGRAEARRVGGHTRGETGHGKKAPTHAEAGPPATPEPARGRHCPGGAVSGGRGVRQRSYPSPPDMACVHLPCGTPCVAQPGRRASRHRALASGEPCHTRTPGAQIWASRLGRAGKSGSGDCCSCLPAAVPLLARRRPPAC